MSIAIQNIDDFLTYEIIIYIFAFCCKKGRWAMTFGMDFSPLFLADCKSIFA